MKWKAFIKLVQGFLEDIWDIREKEAVTIEVNGKPLQPNQIWWNSSLRIVEIKTEEGK